MKLLPLPNTCTVRKRLGSNDYGEPQFGPATKVRCAVIRFGDEIKKSAVRADSSASRGKVDENAAEAVLLLDTTVEIALGDLVTLHGATIQVTDVWPRYDIDGVFHHYQIKGERYPY